jgi:hypothetical protein
MLNINSVRGRYEGEAECRGAFTEGTASLGKDQYHMDIYMGIYLILGDDIHGERQDILCSFTGRDALYCSTDISYL